jgi:D-alanyl-D-alanine carboxypeptidase/D-alanyl-D-alanine-endopeptidase (penicillin-binding protein 4)
VGRLNARRAAVALAIVLAAGCARARPATRPAAPDPVPGLRDDLSRLFLAPAFDQALWAVKVQSLATGEVLYELNAGKLMMPASNMKVVTMSVAADRLGWDHRFETALVSSAPIENGILRGDLEVVGSGDPSVNGRSGPPTRAFAALADQLKAAGITAIEGRIVGDDNRFDDERFGLGWAWDDLPYGFAAPVGALQFNEDLVELTLLPGREPGEPATVDMTPPESDLTIDNRMVTVPRGTAARVELKRLPHQTSLVVEGAVPVGSEPLIRTAAVDNPTIFFVQALRAELVARGIQVGGPAIDIDDIQPAGAHPSGSNGSGGSGEESRRVLASWLSPPLSEIGSVLMKLSQNLYAETLLKVLGSRDGPGSTDSGRQVVADTLAAWGIPDGHLVMADGSGLSRNNYLTAELLIGILTRMRQDPRLAGPFEAALPIAGVDGTLRGRMRATRAEGVARAKTGTIANVRSLSGYVTSGSGEPIVFSILANHFNVPAQTVLDTIDRAVDRLAGFTRSTDALTQMGSDGRR